MSKILAPFQLLELNVISAQDLTRVTRNMRAYAVAWVHPDRKLSTRIDPHGQNNPTWNDKFVFRVDEEFLLADTSAIMIEIYALHWFRDVHVGTVRVLVGNVIPPPTSKPFRNSHPSSGMRFVALQVRRQSGRPEGILNIGVAVLDSSMRSMPLYSNVNSSAVGYRHLMGEDDAYDHHNHLQSHQPNHFVKPELRRTKSDSSSMIGSDLVRQRMSGKKGKASSLVTASEVSSKQRKGQSKGSSFINGSDIIILGKDKNDTSSSIISGSEVIMTGKKGKAGSIINGSEVSEPKKKGKKSKKGKKGSVINGSEAMQTPKKNKGNKDDSETTQEVPLPVLEMTSFDVMSSPKPGAKIKGSGYRASQRGTPLHAASQRGTPLHVASQRGTPLHKSFQRGTPLHVASQRGTPLHGGSHRGTPFHGASQRGTPLYKALQRGTPLHTKSFGNFNNEPVEYGTPMKSNLMGGVFMTESELGPSPSEVAANLAKQPKADETESSMVGGQSLDGSVEGLESKLERWRTELPPVYDQGETSSLPTSGGTRHRRRHTEGGSGGLFSCFSNICGCQCSIVCGEPKNAKKKGAKKQIRRSSSVESLSFI